MTELHNPETLIGHVTRTFLIWIAALMSAFDYCKYPSMTLGLMHL